MTTCPPQAPADTGPGPHLAGQLLLATLNHDRRAAARAGRALTATLGAPAAHRLLHHRAVAALAALTDQVGLLTARDLVDLCEPLEHLEHAAPRLIALAEQLTTKPAHPASTAAGPAAPAVETGGTRAGSAADLTALSALVVALTTAETTTRLSHPAPNDPEAPNDPAPGRTRPDPAGPGLARAFAALACAYQLHPGARPTR